MVTFKVQDMTCGGCAASIRRVVKTIDAAAAIDVDLPDHLVRIDVPESRAEAVASAIRDAGYSPERVA